MNMLTVHKTSFIPVSGVRRLKHVSLYFRKKNILLNAKGGTICMFALFWELIIGFVLCVFTLIVVALAALMSVAWIEFLHKIDKLVDKILDRFDNKGLGN